MKKFENNELKPFWEHVQELRNRLLFVISSIFVFSIIGYIFYDSIYSAIASVFSEEMYVTEITEGFTVKLRVSFLLGAFFCIPIFFFHIVRFVFPALEKKTRVLFLIILVSALGLFIGGIFFSYKSVLPISLQFLRSREFFPENVERIISYEKFIFFFFQFLLGFGLCFQFPIVLIFLMNSGAISVDTLVKYFKYFILIAFTVAAIITPPDIISQLLLTLPMIVLYALCIVIGKLFWIRK